MEEYCKHEMTALDYDNFLSLIIDEPFLDYPKFLNDFYKSILKKEKNLLNYKDIGIYFFDFDFAASYNLTKKSNYDNQIFNYNFIKIIKNKKNKNNFLRYNNFISIEYETLKNSYQQKQIQYESPLSETFSYFLINHKYDFLDVLNAELKYNNLINKQRLYYKNKKKIFIYKYNNNYSYLNNKYL